MSHPWGRSDAFRRASQRSVPVMFIRSNAALFYSVAAASLLEALAPKCAERAHKAFSHDVDFSAWITTDWAPRRVARMHELREYLATTWPEFDCAAACERFLQTARIAPSSRQQSPARLALARCAAASQSALFYRCLAQWAEDATLRALARRMADEDESAFARFSANFRSAERKEWLGMWASWRFANATVRDARDTYVRCAFETLGTQWGPNAPFATMSYSEFVARVRAMVHRYGSLGWSERIVLRAWAKPPSKLALPSKPEPKKPLSFTPILHSGRDAPPRSAPHWGLSTSRTE